MSMGIVGAKSTAGREVKFIDPSKTTKSESTWLGYTLCESLGNFAFSASFFQYMLNACSLQHSPHTHPL